MNDTLAKCANLLCHTVTWRVCHGDDDLEAYQLCLPEREVSELLHGLGRNAKSPNTSHS
jgi:hypothetical protein